MGDPPGSGKARLHGLTLFGRCAPGPLQAKKTNTVKDFLHVAGPLGVTQMISFTCTSRGTYMRLARLPSPTPAPALRARTACHPISAPELTR